MAENRTNSPKYWEERFNTNWNDFGGSEQTKFFAQKLVEMIPSWLASEINNDKLTICDLGCAEGDGVPVYRQKFMTSLIVGEDISDKAVSLAKEKYPEFDFKASDIMHPEKESLYDVVICSNVVEHFKDTYSILGNICKRAEKYAIVLMPYREEEGVIDEHEKVFHTKDIPLFVEDGYLVYAKSEKCDSIYYPYEQILLVYVKKPRFAVLADVVEELSGDREYTLLQKIQELQNEMDLLNSQTSNECMELGNQLVNANNNIAELVKQVKQANSGSDTLKEQLALVNSESDTLKAQLVKLDAENDALKNQLQYAKSVMNQKDEHIIQIQNMCNQFATGKLMKLNHFLFRVKGQLLRGNKEDRKEFWAWLRGKANNTNRTVGQGVIYNPWIVVREKLQEAYQCRFSCNYNYTETLNSIEVNTSKVIDENLPATLQKELSKDYTKYDVIILSVIDYNFRHQRPQHFATRFAANGHRVFYVNANFIRPDSITVEQENLYITDFSSSEYNAIYGMDGKTTLNWMKEKFDNLIYNQAIKDAIVVVDYPNWVYGAEYLREKYGFKMALDYMDDYTGFLGTAEDFVKDNCIELLKNSDLVVASSQFLYDVAKQYANEENITVIRNGTEVEHFYQAIGLEKPHERKIIGYYGAVAHWFAWEKVCYLAKTMPECDIVIVGDVTEHRDKLEKHKNIKLLGEKNYKELPKYLADFDVCLIPFDTSTDLIKATNPVKFYEYLSAGKKVVATEIPELEPFKDQYVYMSNEDEQFAEYVRMCLEGKDSLKGKAECIEFAKENDWQKRYEHFEMSCRNCIPKVSVIVLTYNNLEYNKGCINSILNKTAYGNYELIVVDNQSTDGTIDYLKELEAKVIPNVKIIFNEQNSGFAGGNNLGIAASNGDYVLLLNNDTVITRGWLTAMAKHLENNPKYGMCNPVTNSIGNESMIVAHYTNMKELEEFAYKYTSTHINEEYTDVDRLPLFATMIRKSMIDKIGMLDDSYKIGMFEDDDYTAATIQAGYGITIVEDAFIHHINNASFKKLDDEEYRKIFEKNKAIFESKWKKKWTMPKYREGVTGINVGCSLREGIDE